MGSPIIPEKVTKNFNKHFKNLFFYLLLSGVGGVVCNVAIKKVYLNFLLLPKPFILLGRIVLFALPFGVLWGKMW